jgi:hypothetical protein
VKVEPAAVIKEGVFPESPLMFPANTSPVFDSWIGQVLKDGKIRYLTPHHEGSLIIAVLMGSLPQLESYVSHSPSSLSPTRALLSLDYFHKGFSSNPFVAFFCNELPIEERQVQHALLVNHLENRWKSPLGRSLQELLSQYWGKAEKWSNHIPGTKGTSIGNDITSPDKELLQECAAKLFLSLEAMYGPESFRFTVNLTNARKSIKAFLELFCPYLGSDRIFPVLWDQSFSDHPTFKCSNNKHRPLISIPDQTYKKSSLSNLRWLVEASVLAGLELNKEKDAKAVIYLITLFGSNNGSQEIVNILAEIYKTLQGKANDTTIKQCALLNPKEALDKYFKLHQLTFVYAALKKLDSISDKLCPDPYGVPKEAVIFGLLFCRSKFKEVGEIHEKLLTLALWGSLCKGLAERNYTPIQNRVEAIKIFFPELLAISVNPPKEISNLRKPESLDLKEKMCLLALLTDVDRFNLEPILEPLRSQEIGSKLLNWLDFISTLTSKGDDWGDLISQAKFRLKEYRTLSAVQCEKSLNETQVSLLQSNFSHIFWPKSLNQIEDLSCIYSIQLLPGFLFQKSGHLNFQPLLVEVVSDLPIKEVYIKIKKTSLTSYGKLDEVTFISAEKALQIITGDFYLLADSTLSFKKYISTIESPNWLTYCRKEDKFHFDLRGRTFARTKPESDISISRMEIGNSFFQYNLDSPYPTEIAANQAVPDSLQGLYINVIVTTGLRKRNNTLMLYREVFRHLACKENPFTEVN